MPIILAYIFNFHAYLLTLKENILGNQLVMNSAEFISGARKIVQDNLLNQQFGVLALAHELGVSRSELYRRIKSTENKSASQFIREIRLEKAAELVKSRKYSIAEIAYMVGFNSPTYFSTCYKEYFGFSPSVRGENVFKTTARSSRII